MDNVNAAENIFNYARDGEIDKLKELGDAWSEDRDVLNNAFRVNGKLEIDPKKGHNIMTPLYAAIYNNKTNCVEYLATLNGIDVNKIIDDPAGYRTALHLAASKSGGVDDSEYLNALLKNKDVNVNLKVKGRTPLYTAVSRGIKNNVKVLLDVSGIEVNNKLDHSFSTKDKTSAFISAEPNYLTPLDKASLMILEYKQPNNIEIYNLLKGKQAMHSKGYHGYYNSHKSKPIHFDAAVMSTGGRSRRTSKRSNNKRKTKRSNNKRSGKSRKYRRG